MLILQKNKFLQGASEIKSEIPTVSEDGQEYTIGGETDSFKNLQDEISNG